MTVEDRKKWILDHESDFFELGKESSDNWYKHAIKLWEDGTGLVYTPEEFDRWNETDGEEGKIETIEQTHQRFLNERANINSYLDINENRNLLTDKQFFSKEKVNSVDISKELDEIRYNHKTEKAMYLFIKDGTIVDKYFVNGNRTSVMALSREIVLFLINNASTLDADIYHVHNHPNSFSAMPSDDDKRIGQSLKKILGTFGIELLDWGVVTEWDYYSNNQNEKEG